MSMRSTSMAAANRQRGLSLVELMVAITIGALLLGGAVSLFVSNKVTYQVTSDLSRLQENARFALDTMVRDIRMAGYFGCANDMTKITNNTGFTGGTLWDVSSALEGVNNAADTGTWSPSGRDVNTSGTGTTGDIAAGTDAITVRYASGAGVPVTASTPTLITVSDVSEFTVKDVAVISDCGATDVFLVSAKNTSSNQLTPNALSRAYDPTANPTASTFYAARYYVANNGLTDPDGTPHKSLFRETNIFDPVAGAPKPDPRELIDGVEDMQILYGLDTNADSAPDIYVDAGATELDSAAEWRSVVAVRIALLLRTIDQYGRVIDQKVYRLLGPSGPAFGPYNDTRQRRLFITTAVVRNLQ